MSTRGHSHRDLVLGLIRGSGVTDLDELVDCLESEPYQLSKKDILAALNSLAVDWEIEIESFNFSKDGKIQVRLSDEKPTILLEDDGY